MDMAELLMNTVKGGNPKIVFQGPQMTEWTTENPTPGNS